MSILFDPIFWGIVAVTVGFTLWDRADQKRYIRTRSAARLSPSCSSQRLVCWSRCGSA